MDNKAILDLLRALKESDDKFRNYEKNKAPKLVFWRRSLIISYIIWAVFLIADLLWAIRHFSTSIPAKFTIAISVFLSFFVIFSLYRFIKCNTIPSKYETLISDIKKYLEDKYKHGEAEKAVEFLLNDLNNKRTEIINEYERKAAAFGSAIMIFITAVMSVLVKDIFENKPNSDTTSVILAILLMVILVKILNLAVRGLIKQPAWGRANKEIYLINILNEVKYNFIESDSVKNTDTQSSTTSESESVSGSISESQSVSNL